jgi:hypothetical protein
MNGSGLYIGRKAIAQRLQLSEWSAVENLIDLGLPAAKLSRRWTMDEGLLQEWLREKLARKNNKETEEESQTGVEQNGTYFAQKRDETR